MYTHTGSGHDGELRSAGRTSSSSSSGCGEHPQESPSRFVLSHACNPTNIPHTHTHIYIRTHRRALHCDALRFTRAAVTEEDAVQFAALLLRSQPGPQEDLPDPTEIAFLYLSVINLRLLSLSLSFSLIFSFQGQSEGGTTDALPLVPPVAGHGDPHRLPVILVSLCICR
jgi:hypothetical protein